VYVEEKGGECDSHLHRRNHAIPRARVASEGLGLTVVAIAKAS